MDALIMAGGRGKRMGSPVLKPLIPFRNKPLISWVVEALEACRYTDAVYVALTPKTTGVKECLSAETIITEGAGYVEDLVSAIQMLGLGKTLVLSADLPLITPADLNWVVEEYEKLAVPALSVYVPLSLIRELGLEPGLLISGLVPSGVNIVDGKNLNGEEGQIITEKPSFAFNINTTEDLKAALLFSTTQ